METTAPKSNEISKKVISNDTNEEETKTASVFVGNLSYKTSWQNLKDYMGQVGQVVHATVFKDQTGRSKGCGLVEFKNKQDADNAIKEMNGTTLEGREISVRPDEKGDTREKRPPREFDSKRGGDGGEFRQGPPRTQQRRDFGEKREFGGERREFGGERRGYGGGERREFGGERREFGGERRNYGGDRQERGDREERGDRPPREDRRPVGAEVFVSNLSWELSWQDLKDEFKQFGNVLRADIARDKTGRSAGYGFLTFEKDTEAAAAIEEMNGKTLKGREINVKPSTKKRDSPTKERAE